MTDPQFYIIKIGGAAITNKAIHETLDLDALERTCNCLSTVISESSSHTVIVHGAGSFGHQTAHSAGLTKGDLKSAIVRSGLVDTRCGDVAARCACLSAQRGDPVRPDGRGEDYREKEKAPSSVNGWGLILAGRPSASLTTLLWIH